MYNYIYIIYIVQKPKRHLYKMKKKNNILFKCHEYDVGHMSHIILLLKE